MHAPKPPESNSSQTIRLFVWMGAVIGVSCATLLFAFPDGRGPASTIGIGYLLGSLFAHTTMAAAWCAFGPAKLVWRLPFSLLWVAALVGVIQLSFALRRESHVAMMISVSLLAQFVLLQIPLWGLALGLRLHLRHYLNTAGEKKQLQFGIVHLMVVTAISAVLLGIGRLCLGLIPWNRDIAIFVFLAAAAVVFTLPLLLAALMNRWALLAIPALLAVIALATYWELSLMKTFISGPGPNMEHFISINAFSVGVLLLFALVVRLNGFRLFIRPAAGLA